MTTQQDNQLRNMHDVHMVGRTPLPWRITEPGEKKGPREIVGSDGSTVAKLTALDLPNAELIVTAVNSTPQANYSVVK
jgi:hypothetical protein